MSNTVDFILRLRDLMSPAIASAGVTAKEVFGGVDNKLSQTQKHFNDLSKPLRFNVDTSELDRANNSMRTLSSTWSMMKGSLLARGIEMGVGQMRGVGMQALTSGADAEQQLIALKTFVGATRARDIYNDIQRSSALTPFTTAQILPGEQMLIAAGLTAEKAKRDQWALMNALSATGNAGNAFALDLGQQHLSQMASTGRVDAYFMKEFQRTLHIPMERLLSDYMHLPQKTIGEWTHNGELAQHVTYDTFVGAMDRASKAGGMFAGALEAQSQTIKGKWSTIKDWWNIGLAKTILEPRMHDNITKLEDRIISGLQDLPELAGKMAGTFNTMFNRVDDLWPSFSKLGNSLIDLMKPIGGVLLSEEFRSLGKSVLDVATDFAKTLEPAVKDLAAGLKLASGDASDFINWIRGKKGDNKPTGKTTHWQIGDPIFETPGQAKLREIYEGNLSWGILKKDAPFFETRDQLAHRAMWSAMPDLGFNASRSAGAAKDLDAFAANFPGQQYNTDSDEAKKVKKQAAAAMQETGDAIIGGGIKQVNISFRNFAEHFTVQAGNLKEGVDKTEDWFKEMFLRVLNVVPA